MMSSSPEIFILLFHVFLEDILQINIGSVPPIYLFITFLSDTVLAACEVNPAGC